MQVRDIMSRDARFINCNSSILEAAKLMKRENIGCLPVEEDDRMIGMLTDRDIVLNAIAENRDTDDTPVRNCMSSGIKFLYEDEDVAAACRKLARHQVRRMPVVNGDKRLVGLLSVDDIAPSMVDDELYHETMCAIVVAPSQSRLTDEDRRALEALESESLLHVNIEIT